MSSLRTAKQEAIAEAIRRSPSSTDGAIAKDIGASRNLVRRIRKRVAQIDGTLVHREPMRLARWRPALDPVFKPGGFADELEAFIETMVRAGGLLDHRIAQMETHARGHRLGLERHRLVREIYNLARKLQRELVPVGPCPFCSNGCASCGGGGWAPENQVDAGALLEDINAKRRWWRVHRTQVPM